MMGIMRTTVSIDDQLLEASKQRARGLGVTLGQFIEEALRRQLSGRRLEAEAPVIPVFRGGTGPRPGLDIVSNRALLEVLDDDVPLEQLR